MSVLDIKASIDVRGVQRMLGRIKAVDIKKAFLEVRGPARFDQNHHWRKDEAPDGRWPPLAASTLERRLRPRGRDKNGRNRSWPKKLLGRFPTSLQSIATSRSLIVRSRIRRFDWIHQAGGTAGHGARIPRRQYLWISAWLKLQAKKVFEQALQRAAGAR